MEQHPIPQQISSYSFKLVGDMTLKQFSQLAAGALISLLFYASPLNPVIKWPLIVISFLFGVALAFLPIEDRPLGTWIIIFFRSIYSPTIFVWSKLKIAPQFFKPEPGAAAPRAPSIAQQIQARPTSVEVPQTPAIEITPAVSKLEEKEKSFLTKVGQGMIEPNTTILIETPPLYANARPIIESTKMAIPKTGPTEIPKTENLEVAQPTTTEAPKEATTINAGSEAMFSSQINAAGTQAKFSDEVMPPLPPSKANTIVGQVLSSDGKIVEGAILEIRDAEGRPVRALRSNKLGHFMIITPLLNGKYQIITEKDGLTFDPLVFDAEDKIISPIAIWAKKPSMTNGDDIKEGDVFKNT